MLITEAAASAAARAFFYPSLAWNIARNKFQETWHWWDEITEAVILGALPFYGHIEQLKELGVRAVVTLNEEFEVFITSEQYKEAGLTHLHIPTVDFLFAPPIEDLHKGADFIHENAGGGSKTYVHCKAGRGRSTTLVLCYLLKYYGYTPEQAYTFVRQKRPQVYLAQGQWTAVCSFYGSCHPELDFDLSAFPYPKFAPPPQATTSEGLDEAEEVSCSPGGSMRSHTWPGGTPEPVSVEKSSSWGLLTGDDTPQCISKERSQQNLEQAGTSQMGGSILSLDTIATALQSCSAQPFPESGGVQTIPQDMNALLLPTRSASPAIDIPQKTKEEEDKEKSNASSKCSISLEPSGSLPGYVRIAPYRRSIKRSTANVYETQGSAVADDNCLPAIQSGFSQICQEDEDWASVYSD